MHLLFWAPVRPGTKNAEALPGGAVQIGLIALEIFTPGNKDSIDGRGLTLKSLNGHFSGPWNYSASANNPPHGLMTTCGNLLEQSSALLKDEQPPSNISRSTVRRMHETPCGLLCRPQLALQLVTARLFQSFS
jgi:hypothetical protein